MGDLSSHFSRAEMTATDTGLPNEPDSQVIWDRLSKVCQVLEHIRAGLGCPIHVNSGYRSEAVNMRAGGSETSAHHLGLAADIVPQGVDLLEAYNTIRDNPVWMAEVDQLIWEQKALPRGGFVRWIHVGVGHGPNGDLPLRHSALIYGPKTAGKYLPFDPTLIA